MGIQTIYSIKKTIDEAAQDLILQIREHDPKTVIFFASPSYDPSALSKKMNEIFSKSTVIGCTSAGEIVSGKMLTDSIVTILLGSDIVDDVCFELVRDIKTGSGIHSAFMHFSNYYDVPLTELDVKRYVGIILIDGLSNTEEHVMDTIGNLTDVTFIGGAAGDNLKFKETFVFANGESATNAAVLLLLKLKQGFDIIKTQSFCSTGKKLKATSVNEKARTVSTFNDIPASKAYASVLNCTEKDAAEKFMSNPLGLMIGNEPYIRSPQRFDMESMVFYCNIKEGMELDVMFCTDIVKDTREAVDKKLKEYGTLRGIIDFHCILRTLELRQKNLCDAYGAIFKDIPTIGFSTYGEEYIGHINQTSTMLIFL